MPEFLKNFMLTGAQKIIPSGGRNGFFGYKFFSPE
jgi:hypothetical protein